MLPPRLCRPQYLVHSVQQFSAVQQYQKSRVSHISQQTRRIESLPESRINTQIREHFPRESEAKKKQSSTWPLSYEKQGISFPRLSPPGAHFNADSASRGVRKHGRSSFQKPLALWIRSRTTIPQVVVSQQEIPAAKHRLPLQVRYKSSSTSISNSTISEDQSSTPQTYKPPTTGVLSYLPSSFVPYAELIRLDKPTGTYYLFFPCLFSTLLAASVTPLTPPSSVISTSLLFLAGALVMRGAGCAINDLHDRKLDPHVSRTRLRPLARGALAPFSALAFTSSQLLLGLIILLQFPLSCLAYGIPSLLFVGTYPLFKRITHYPQFILGLTFSWGAMMGFPALGIDLVTDTTARVAAACLYASCVSWTVLYDFIYAHMDVKDDMTAGIKSIAVKHGSQTKVILAGLAVIQVGFLAAAGTVVGFGPIYFVGTCGGAALSLGIMISRVRLTSVQSCWGWFKRGAWFTGLAVSSGLLGEYVARLIGWVEIEGNEEEKSEVEMKEDI
jgi:4-hydroxybenzoate polyprenyltransferase